MREGFIKDYRQELDSDIWIMPPLYHRVWQYLKYEVNHNENEIPMKDGTKFLVKKGQRLTSYRNIAKSIGWYEGLQWKEPNPKTVKTICDWLEKNNMIIQEHGKGNRQFTLITIVNWGLYQCKKDEGVTVNKQESNIKVTEKKQVADINKNDNNEKNEKEVDSNISNPLPKKETIKENYKEIYIYYLSLGLIKHKEYTTAMKNAIQSAMKSNKYTIEECKTLLERHKKVVEITKGNEYSVKARPLVVFFGQKVANAKHLICSEYEEGGAKYEKYLKESFKPKDITPSKVSNEFDFGGL